MKISSFKHALPKFSRYTRLGLREASDGYIVQGMVYRSALVWVLSPNSTWVFSIVKASRLSL